MDYSCEFCNRTFKRERTVKTHRCEPRRRFGLRNDKAVQLGFMAFQQFYLREHKKPPTYTMFTKNTMYTAFERFGNHLIKLNAINSVGFIDFLLETQAKIDNWTNPTLYTDYVKHFTKTEDPIDAVERNFKLMHQWSSEIDLDWRTFFYHVETPLAILWIVTGRISPWILFTASSAHGLLDRLTAEQMRMIEQTIDQSYWQLKIQRHDQEVDAIRLMLAEYDI